MTQSDTARVAIWQTATVHDETGALLATGGQWTDEHGRPITDPDRRKELRQRMDETTVEYELGDKVVILDDAGDETDQTGTVEQDLGMGTYLVLLDDGTRIGTQPSHMQKIEDDESE